ncbi:hypothetical protein GCU67_10690 [Modestobacter muralis]|uniref:Bacterial spore germination immunoglobulin-like domain-containing protein n=1 Tax=Modestobacter muralis TaxID=1608614 RepID=A0A6P0H725_9ACTN|nr:hypothetical protein [Modestobacter muralis]NEK94633.1 hypothetical protein [Modestobacter muralis]NEN51521.1 hypothetical protein [Modestobacter muralis]
MRSPAGWVLAVVVLALLPGCTGAQASCAAPEMSVAPSQARVGDQVVVTMARLQESCSGDDGSDEDRPLTEVPVSFVQGGTRVPLARVAGRGDGFAGSITVPVPAQAVPGAALVTAGDTDWLTVPLTVLP